MNEILDETVQRLFSDHGAARDADRETVGEELWARLADLEMTSVGVAEADGGAGGTSSDAAVIVRAAARHAAPIPIAETLLMATMLGVRTRAPSAPWTVAVRPGELPRLHRTASGPALSGRAARVPWVRTVEWVAVVADDGDGQVVVSVPAQDCPIECTDVNLAGEPRDTLLFDHLVLSDDQVVGGVELSKRALAAAATARAVQISGVLEEVLEATVRYANEREQFGGPLGRFQAVQQLVAELAAEVAAARAAADAAVVALDALDRNDGWRAAAAAKVRTGRAATVGARVAHQVHGAMGFSQEHGLHRLTRRLWSWREECGAEAYWGAELGRAVLSAGGSRLWPSLTD